MINWALCKVKLHSLLFLVRLMQHIEASPWMRSSTVFTHYFRNGGLASMRRGCKSKVYGRVVNTQPAALLPLIWPLMYTSFPMILCQVNYRNAQKMDPVTALGGSFVCNWHCELRSSVVASIVSIHILFSRCERERPCRAGWG